MGHTKYCEIHCEPTFILYPQNTPSCLARNGCDSLQSLDALLGYPTQICGNVCWQYNQNARQAVLPHACGHALLAWLRRCPDVCNTLYLSVCIACFVDGQVPILIVVGPCTILRWPRLLAAGPLMHGTHNACRPFVRCASWCCKAGTKVCTTYNQRGYRTTSRYAWDIATARTQHTQKGTRHTPALSHHHG